MPAVYKDGRQLSASFYYSKANGYLFEKISDKNAL